MQEAMFYASQNYNRNHFIYKNINRAPSSSHRPANWACWPESYNTSNRNKKKYEAVEKMASYIETDYNPIKVSNLLMLRMPIRMSILLLIMNAHTSS